MILKNIKIKKKNKRKSFECKDCLNKNKCDWQYALSVFEENHNVEIDCWKRKVYSNIFTTGLHKPIFIKFDFDNFDNFDNFDDLSNNEQLFFKFNNQENNYEDIYGKNDFEELNKYIYVWTHALNEKFDIIKEKYILN